jgi:hypothetical protein
MMNSSLWTMPDSCCKLALTCICKANWEPTKTWDPDTGGEVIVPRGGFRTTLSELADLARMSRGTTISALKRLVAVGFIKRVPRRSFTVLLLPNYDRYQSPQNYYSKDVRYEGRPQSTPPTIPPTIPPTVPPTIPRGSTHNDKEVKKGRKEEENKAPLDGFTPPRPVNAPEIFLANQFHQYISDEIGKEKCSVCFKNALKRGLSSADMNAAIESKWNEGVVIFKWIEAFEKNNGKNETRPRITSAKIIEKEMREAAEAEGTKAAPDPEREKLGRELQKKLLKFKPKSIENPNGNKPEATA